LSKPLQLRFPRHAGRGQTGGERRCRTDERSGVAFEKDQPVGGALVDEVDAHSLAGSTQLGADCAGLRTVNPRKRVRPPAPDQDGDRFDARGVERPARVCQHAGRVCRSGSTSAVQ
jgi:hypothetical protein